MNKFIFSFTRYIQPGWYFWLPSAGDVCYWADVRKLAETDRQLLNTENGYDHEESFLRDTAYQLLLKGYIARTQEVSLVLSDHPVSVADEYRFIRRFYHAWWSRYVLILRCLTGHNPFREWKSYNRAKHIKRVDVYRDIFVHDALEKIHDSPRVSIIIPTLNRYAYLTNILADLAQQTYRNFEVIVIDQSNPYRADFYDTFDLPLRVIRQEEPGLWKARNNGIRESTGTWIAFSEDDVRVTEDWLQNHLACTANFGVDISAGIFFPEGTAAPVHKAHFRWSEQFASGNALVKRTVFNQIGLFDLQFERMRMGDGEFGLRAYRAGISSVSNPKAYALDVKAPEGGLRQMGSWDAFRPTSLLAPRPVPSVLYLIRRYFGKKIMFYDLLVKVPMSVIPFRFKKNSKLYWAGALVALVMLPFVAIQIFRSWRKSSRMLHEGPNIQKLST